MCVNNISWKNNTYIHDVRKTRVEGFKSDMRWESDNCLVENGNSIMTKYLLLVVVVNIVEEWW
jgi:hypothetical protein